MPQLCDNCPAFVPDQGLADPDQTDSDSDGSGDPCDSCNGECVKEHPHKSPLTLMFKVSMISLMTILILCQMTVITALKLLRPTGLFWFDAVIYVVML